MLSLRERERERERERKRERERERKREREKPGWIVINDAWNSGPYLIYSDRLVRLEYPFGQHSRGLDKVLQHAKYQLSSLELHSTK